MPIDVNPQSFQFEKVALPVLLDGNYLTYANNGINPYRDSDGSIIDASNAQGAAALMDRYNSDHGPGSLMDYLGMRGLDLQEDAGQPSTAQRVAELNIFPFLAYHRVCDKYYKNSLVQCKAFSPRNLQTDVLSEYAVIGSMPYELRSYSGSDLWPVENCPSLASMFYDGVRLGELRQRNFGSDYFTAATPSPQLGDAPLLTMQVEDDASSFSIAALRSINAMTLFLERNNLSGTDFDRWLESRGGKPLRETTEPVYLGRQVITVYSNAVTQDSNAQGTQTQNPFESVGARYGLASAVGEDTLIDDFEVEQPGYIMVLVSLVPKVSYSTGARRYLKHFTQEGCRADIADSLLEPIGPQPIYTFELDSTEMYYNMGSVFTPTVFGYIDRYAEFKTMEDEIHGLMRDGEDLQSFALQRSFDISEDGQPSIGNDFLQIPTDYLDQVAAVDGDISRFGFWADFYFDYRVTMPLGRSVMPSLIDPAVFDGKTVYLPRANKTL